MKNFIKRLISFVLSALQSVITLYINGDKNDQTADWKKLIAGLLPMIFSYLETPILQGVENTLSGSDKFQKAVEYVNKYLAKYVNVSVAQEDIMAFIQHSYFKWLEDVQNHKDVVEKVVMNDKEITIFEVVHDSRN